MHYIRHRRMLQSLKFSSLFFILVIISAITFLGLLIFYYISGNELNYAPIIITASLTALFSLFNLLSASKCRCQLCQVAMMLRMGCNKNSKAKSLFGSYRLRLALGVLFKNSYRCPACGESFSCLPPPLYDSSSSAKKEAIYQASANYKARNVSTLRRSPNVPLKRKV